MNCELCCDCCATEFQDPFPSTTSRNEGPLPFQVCRQPSTDYLLGTGLDWAEGGVWFTVYELDYVCGKCFIIQHHLQSHGYFNQTTITV